MPRFKPATALRNFIADMAEHASAHGIGEAFVRICESFCGCGEQVAEHGGKAAAAAAATAPAAAAVGVGAIGLPILGPLAISIGLFGVTFWMKCAREAKAHAEREKALHEIRQISAAVKALNENQQNAQEKLISLVEKSGPVWARISGADQKEFARIIDLEFREEFRQLNRSLDDFGILSSDTNGRVRIIEDSIRIVIEANGSFASVLQKIETGIQAANAKLDQVLAELQSQGAFRFLEDFAPPRPAKYVPRPGPMQALYNALWNTGRATITGQAHGARAAAHGEGGQGKSVLSLAYAEDYADRYPGGRYRVIVENQSLETVLARMIPALPALQQMSQSDKARLARTFLSCGPQSLLIIDNVDRLADWTNPAFQSLIPAGACHVIVTSREDYLPNITPIPVGKLEESEARAILAAFRPSAADPANAAAVANILRLVELLAVAVASVGALMSIAEDDDWAAYAKRLDEIPLDQYPEAHPDVVGHTGYPRRVFTALDDLFNRLPALAQRAMEYAALLPEDLIPTEWLTNLLASDVDPANPDPLELGMRPTGRPWETQDFVKKIQSLGLLTPANPERTLWSLHRLHGKRCRERMDKETRARLWFAISEFAQSRLAVVVGKKPDGDLRGVDDPAALTDPLVRWELTPLASTCAALWQAGSLRDAAQLAAWLGGVLRTLGRLGEAASCLSPVPKHDKILERILEPSVLANCYSNLGTIRQAQGDLAGARTNLERAIAIQQKHLGSDYSKISAGYNNLATIDQAEGDLAGARANTERAIAVLQEHLAWNHPWIATSYSNLATIQKEQGDLDGARTSIERAIAIQQKHLASGHPSIATSYSNLATIQQDQGDLAAARSSVERAIAIQQRHLPWDHPLMATSFSNLAVIQKDQGELAAARTNIERAIAIEQKHFAPDHPKFATRYNNLALICHAEGNRAAACENLKKALNILLRNFDETHHYVKRVRISMQSFGCPD